MIDTLSQLEINRMLVMLGDPWSAEPKGLTRSARFKSYLDAVKFFELLAPKCEAMNHHPDVEWSYTSVTVSLITHSVNSVTNLDVELAKAIDEVITLLN